MTYLRTSICIYIYKIINPDENSSGCYVRLKKLRPNTLVRSAEKRCLSVRRCVHTYALLNEKHLLHKFQGSIRHAFFDIFADVFFLPFTPRCCFCVKAKFDNTSVRLHLCTQIHHTISVVRIRFVLSVARHTAVDRYLKIAECDVFEKNV